jgi:hypothetical protein
MADIDSFENGMTPEEMAALEEENRQPANPEAPAEISTKPVQAEETETLPAPSTEQKTDEEEEGSEPGKKPDVINQDDEDKLPFHKHPRWIAQQQKLKEKDEQIARLTEAQERIEARIRSVDEAAEKDQPLAIPEWFTELYGSDDPEKDQEVYQRYLVAEKAREDELVARATERISAEKTQQAEQESADLEWVDSQIAAVRAGMEDGDQAFEDNDLLKIIRDYKPMKEEDGALVPDFVAAYGILKALNGSKSPAPTTQKPVQATTQKKALAAHTPAAVSTPETETIASNESLALDRPW